MVIRNKRIKNRNNATGRDATWSENFDDFEKIYGTMHSVKPPVQNLQSSLKSTFETENMDFECVTNEECEKKPSGSKNSKRKNEQQAATIF